MSSESPELHEPDSLTRSCVEAIGSTMNSPAGLLVMPVKFDGEAAWALGIERSDSDDPQEAIVLALVVSDPLLARVTSREGYVMNYAYGQRPSND